MKKIILIALLIVCAYSVSAERMLEIEEIKWYQNDDRISDIDFSGDIEDIYRKDVITIKIDLDNRDDEEMEDIKIMIEIKDIDDGDDLEEELSKFDLDEGDDVRKEISFKIPNDAELDSFDMFLKIRATTHNNTEEVSIFNYTIDIIEKPFDIEAVLTDINHSLRLIRVDVSDSFSNKTLIDSLNRAIGEKDGIVIEKEKTITDKTDKIGTLELIIIDKDKKIDELEETEDSNTVLIDKLTPKAAQYDSLKVKHSCDTNINTCVDKIIEDKDKSFKFLIYGFIAAGIGFYYWRKNKDKFNTKIGGEKSIPEKRSSWGM